MATDAKRSEPLEKDRIKVGVHYHSPLADYEERTGKTLKEMVRESINKYLPTKYQKEKSL